MNKWEYCNVTALETSEKTQFTISYLGRVETPPVNGRLTVLAEMGRRGWELVAVYPVTLGANEFYFKRQVAA